MKKFRFLAAAFAAAALLVLFLPAFASAAESEEENAQAPAYVEIADRWTFAGEQNTLTLNLLTAKEPQAFPDSILLDSGEGRLRLSWEGAPVTALSEWIPIADAKLSPVWGDGVWRLVLTVENPAREGQIRLRFEKE